MLQLLLFMLVTVIIFVLIGAFIILRYTKQLKADARQCAKEAEHLHKKLGMLTDPSHLFNDEELHQIKREYTPLLRRVYQLYDNPFISNDYLNDLGLEDFIDERKHLNHFQLMNNKKKKKSNEP